jgi:Protein of unknown function (DUF1552)
MVMPKFRLNRRALIKGAGSIAIALPWLEAMGPERTARGATTTTPAKRFLAVFQPGGTVRNNAVTGIGADHWAPTGTETNFTLSPILAPLAPVQNNILVLDNIDLKSAVGEQHQSGIIAFLTGTTQANAGTGYSTGPSIDQVLSTTLSAGKKKPSQQMAVRWATGKSHGNLSPINCANFENNATPSPIPPDLDPQQIFTDLFGSLTTGPSTGPSATTVRQQSILDFVDKRYVALEQKLGPNDRAKLDEHLTKIRELETSLTINVSTSATCHAPTKVDTTGYNPRSGLGGNTALLDTGMLLDIPTDTLIPKVGAFMMDMMVMALACDITGVGTFQWSDTEAKHTFPWLNLSEHHHFYQHDGGFQPVQCEQIATWYSTQHLYLLQKMAATDMGGHSLLDESVVFFGSELSHPPTHMKIGMPFILAGGGGGLRTGRYVKQPANVSHNNLLVSILNLFGDTRTTFGSPAYCTGPLAGF